MTKPMTKLEGNIKFKLLSHGPKWLSYKENNETFFSGENTTR